MSTSMIITKFFCSTMMSIVGLKAVKSISGADTSLVSLRSILLMTLLVIIPAVLHGIQYSYAESIIIFIITVITYKEILNVSLINSTISCGIFHFFLIVLEFIGCVILVPFFTIDTIRSTPFINIIINIVFAVISMFVFTRTKLRNWLPKFIHSIENKNRTRMILFLILVIVAMSIVLYSLSQNYRISDLFSTNFSIFIIFFLLVLILFSERNDYEKLSSEYDNLFKYIQIFEDWIEREQLTRHEYKNQLAVLRNLTKEKKVKDKIDSIVEDFIDIDKEMISQLKNMPNGGLKGLLYYKISVARKNKINIDIMIDEKSGKTLSKLSDDKQKILTKLLGIYIDNAIEAACETKKKNIFIEVYQLKEKVTIVISNSYDQNKNISNRNNKGVSTKGEGRGNGLYFASKLVSMNKWIEDKQEIKEDYYIQYLNITK